MNAMKKYDYKAFYCNHCDKVFYVPGTECGNVIRCPYGCPKYNAMRVLSVD